MPSVVILAAFLSAWTRTDIPALPAPVRIEVASNVAFVVGGDGTLWRSSDSGRSWRTVQAGFTGVTSVTADPVFATTASSIWKSIDAGVNWTRVGSQASLELLASNAATLYAAAPATLLQSTDGGVTFRSLLSGHITDIALDPFNASTVYAVSAGLARSTDGGRTWSYPFNASFITVSNVTVDPVRPDTVYVTATNRVLVSRDAGKTWSSFPVTLDGRELNVAELYADRASFYATTYPDGIVRSLDGGLSWMRISDGLPQAFVSALAVDPAGRCVLAAVDHIVYRLDLTVPRKRAVKPSS